MTNHKIFCTVLVEIQKNMGNIPNLGDLTVTSTQLNEVAQPEAVERFARSRYWPQDLRELMVPQFGIAKLVRS